MGPPPVPKPSAKKASQPSGGDFVNLYRSLPLPQKNMAFQLMTKMLSDVNAAVAPPPAVEVSIPEDKIQKVQDQTQEFLSRPVIGLRKLRTYAGSLSFIAGLVPHLRPFLTSIWAAQAMPPVPPGPGYVNPEEAFMQQMATEVSSMLIQNKRGLLLEVTLVFLFFWAKGKSCRIFLIGRTPVACQKLGSHLRKCEEWRKTGRLLRIFKN